MGIFIKLSLLEQRLKYAISTIQMDYTQWPCQSKPKSPMINAQDNFFTMISSDSLDQFQAIRLSIISGTKRQQQDDLSNLSQKNQSDQNQLKDKDYKEDQDIESSQQSKPRRNASLSPRSFANQTYYQSLRKNQIADNYSQKDQSPSKKGIISLLQASLKFQPLSKQKIKKQTKKYQQKNIKKNDQTEKFVVRNQNYNIIVFPSSYETTEICEQFILMPPSLSMLSGMESNCVSRSSRRSQNKIILNNHPKAQQVKKGIPILNSKQQKNIIKQQNNPPTQILAQKQVTQKPKVYRIQKPDQIFDQLQKQKEKEKQLPKMKHARPTEIVTNNLINAKMLLNQDSVSSKKNSINSKNNSANSMFCNKDSQNSPQTNYKFSPSPSKHTTVALQPIMQGKQGKNFITLFDSDNLSPHHKNGNQNKIERIISTCLFRLNDQNFQYTKCKYQINELQLIINNCYHISYSNIKKIKLIYSEFNRPQIKLTYMHPAEDAAKYKQSYKYRVSKDTDDTAGRRQQGRLTLDPRASFIESMNGNGHGSGKQKEVIIYMCESYESIYTIISSIITRKLLRQPQICQLLKLDSLAVTCHMLTNGLKSGDPHYVTFNYKIDGTVMKKSKHLKNWQKRYIQIENFKLKSYRITYLPISLSPTLKKRSQKNEAPMSPTLAREKLKNSSPDPYPQCRQSFRQGIQKISNECTFQLSEIKQLWTRFQIIDRKYLVMKMHKKNKIQKIQIAIPVINYSNVYSRDNWLFGFVSLLKGQL